MIIVYDIYEAPTRVSAHTTSGSMNMQMTNTLKTNGSGTVVSHHLEIELGGLVKLIEPVLARMIKGQITKIFANLKDLPKTQSTEEIS
jgi:carbon monoxide dehydrogenase subunit G